MNDKEVYELVKKLDTVLSKHDLTFDEYLLSKALHEYENNNAKVFENINSNELIKTSKIVNKSKIEIIEKSIMELFSSGQHNNEFAPEDFDRIINFAYVSKIGVRPPY